MAFRRGLRSNVYGNVSAGSGQKIFPSFPRWHINDAPRSARSILGGINPATATHHARSRARSRGGRNGTCRANLLYVADEVSSSVARPPR